MLNLKRKTKIILIFSVLLPLLLVSFFTPSNFFCFTNYDLDLNLPESPKTSARSEICRPCSNIQIQWDSAHYNRIDEDTTYPDGAGDGLKNYNDGYSETKTDEFELEQTTGEGELIDAITIYALCSLWAGQGGYSQLKVSYRICLNGQWSDWSSQKVVSSTFPLTWKAFTWDNIGICLEESTTIKLRVRLVSRILSTRYGGDVYVDAMYSELNFMENPIEIISPEETTYTSAMEGYFPGTFSFENDEDGTAPSGWTATGSTGTCTTTVISEWNNHKKVLHLYDADEYGTYAQIDTTFSNDRTMGMIEFWFQTTDISKPFYISLSDGTFEKMKFQLSGGKWYYFKNFVSEGVIEGLSTQCENNVWYRIQIHFESGHWNFEINDDVSKAMDCNSLIDTLTFETDGAGYQLYNIYIDAVGFSWKNYVSEDNKYEGIFLDFTPDDLVWMGYSLDGEETITISGDVVLPMLKTGSHTLQVFGEDSEGFQYQSSIRSFTIDVFDKIGVFLFSSQAGSEIGETIFSEEFEASIHVYKGILSAENYNKFYIYRDILDINAVMERMADFRVDSQDIVFFHIEGHGEYVDVYPPGIDYSFVNLNTLVGNAGGMFTSTDFGEYLDMIDSTKKGFLVDSCYAGGFYYNFLEEDDVLAISSSDPYNEAWTGPFGDLRAGVFSFYFFNFVSSGYDAKVSFFWAKLMTYIWCSQHGKPPQNPLKKDHSTYTFFAS